jgi:hypothetical protein
MMVDFPDPLVPYSTCQICVSQDAAAQTYHKRCYFPGRDLEGKFIENPCVWSSGVTEADLIDVDNAVGNLRSGPRFVERIDLGLPIDQGEKLCSSSGSSAE